MDALRRGRAWRSNTISTPAQGSLMRIIGGRSRSCCSILGRGISKVRTVVVCDVREGMASKKG